MTIIKYKAINSYSKEIQDFINYFLDSAYANMDMENEAIYPRDKLFDRYRITIESLIKEWAYKGLKYKQHTYV